MARAAAAEIRDERARAVPDPDEYAANLISRGYAPGQLSLLHGRLADTEAELADEEAKIERASKRAARVQRDFAAGKIGMAELLRAQDADEGDSRKVEKLQRRADSLRRQIQEAAEASMPRAQREANAVEAAVSRSQAILADVARMRAEDDAAMARGREKLEADRKAFYAARSRRPFAGSGAPEEGEQVSERADLPAPLRGVVAGVEPMDRRGVASVSEVPTRRPVGPCLRACRGRLAGRRTGDAAGPGERGWRRCPATIPTVTAPKPPPSDTGRSGGPRVACR